MEFAYSLDVDAPLDRVWALLRDPQAMAPAIPGFQSLEVVDDETFRVKVAQRVGPFRAQFDLEIALIEVVESKRLAASGQGTETGGSWLKVPLAVVELESLADDKTRLSFNMEFSLLGKLGALGYPVVKQKAGEMARRFGENLKQALERGARG